METTGTWYERKWEINYSGILSQLIQYAGRYCESFASDLFVIWNYRIEKHMTERNWEGCELRLGFREMGVDVNEEIDFHSDYPSYYYRKTATVVVTVEGDRMKMELK